MLLYKIFILSVAQLRKINYLGRYRNISIDVYSRRLSS